MSNMIDQPKVSRPELHNDDVSHLAQWSQWETSTDNDSMVSDSTPCKNRDSQDYKGTRSSQQPESCEETDGSLTVINDILNPLESVKNFLVRKNLIPQQTEENKEMASQKLLSLVEELGRNFYYAFLAQSALSIVKGAVSPKSRFLPSLFKVFGKKNLAMWAFLAALGSSYKFVMERLRKLSANHDKINTLLSILLATWSLTKSKSSGRVDYTYYLVIWKYLEVMSKVLEKGKVIKKVKNFDVEFYELSLLHFTLRFSLRVKVSRRKIK